MELLVAQAAGMSPMQRAGHWVRLLDPGDTGQTSLVPASDFERYLDNGFKPLGGKPAQTVVQTPAPGITTRSSTGRGRVPRFGADTIRSSHPLNIFRKGAAKPMWVVEGASSSGGRKIIAGHALEDNGEWRGSSTDVGSLADDKQPFFYLHFMGGEMAMTDTDMKEVIGGMKDKNAERLKREGRKPLPDLKAMREQLREAQKYLDEKRRGVSRFTV